MFALQFILNIHFSSILTLSSNQGGATLWSELGIILQVKANTCHDITAMVKSFQILIVAILWKHCYFYFVDIYSQFERYLFPIFQYIMFSSWDIRWYSFQKSTIFTWNITVKLLVSQIFSQILSWRRSLSYRNQSIDLLCKSMDWFLYDNGLRHDRVKFFLFSQTKGSRWLS